MSAPGRLPLIRFLSALDLSLFKRILPALGLSSLIRFMPTLGRLTAARARIQAQGQQIVGERRDQQEEYYIRVAPRIENEAQRHDQQILYGYAFFRSQYENKGDRQESE
jgi:hypothetical protein